MEEPEIPTSGQIKQLDVKTARHISSGQVITSLSVAVKELMENAIDAKATALSIRFDGYYEKIDVIDNGHGIEKINFELLGKRSCTSKLASFEDLDNVGTFGFRGEAINSLCNIAHVTMHTRHATDTIGTFIVFDMDGKITSKEARARNLGTTVSLSQLFYSLPVRRKELASTYKRSFDQTLAMIYQYCVGSVGLKISCFLKKNNQNFSNLFTCNGASVQSNIIEIFDYKQFSSLMPFVCHTDLESSTSEAIAIEITGFISKPDTGCGRSSPDRHYFYLNERPCDLPSASKQINQIYRSYNRNQYPFVLLKLTVEEKLIDRNLTPDKRKILLADNHYILKVIVHSLDRMFSRETVDVLSLSSSQLMTSFLASATPSLKRNIIEEDSSVNVSKILKRCPSPHDASFEIETHDELESSRLIEEIPLHESIDPVPYNSTSTRSNLSSFCMKDSRKSAENSNVPQISNPTGKVKHPFFDSFTVYKDRRVVDCQEGGHEMVDAYEPILTSNQNSSNAFEQCPNTDQNTTTTEELEKEHIDLSDIVELEVIEKDIPQDESLLDDADDNAYNDKEMISLREETLIDFNIEDISEAYRNALDESRPSLEDDTLAKLKAKITPEDNDNALSELRHTLTKQSFAQMRVIGQFNLGFIITRLGDHLFIIDQHAIDERYNFEKLLDNPKVEYQNLVCPLNLRLSSSNEMVVMDNLETFKKLGFGITIKNSAPPGHRTFLTRIPLGKEWSGSLPDIEEAIVAIRDSPSGDILENKHFMLSGLRREIAYRACRSSVMIGDCLLRRHMQAILAKVGGLRDPWHCAHNRPTIRHLLSLRQFKLT